MTIFDEEWDMEYLFRLTRDHGKRTYFKTIY